LPIIKLKVNSLKNKNLNFSENDFSQNEFKTHLSIFVNLTELSKLLGLERWLGLRTTSLYSAKYSLATYGFYKYSGFGLRIGSKS
jgi:hypothetical protein